MEPFFQMVKDGDISRVVEFIRQSSYKPDEILDAELLAVEIQKQLK